MMKKKLKHIKSGSIIVLIKHILNLPNKDELCIQTYSWREFKNTRDVYSSKSDVFDSVSASLFGLENANAVPTGDLLRAPISIIVMNLM